jgi:primosomal protein N'
MPPSCPECNGTVSADADECHLCGASIGEDEPDECPRCGGELNETGLLGWDVQCEDCAKNYDLAEV